MVGVWRPTIDPLINVLQRRKYSAGKKQEPDAELRPSFPTGKGILHTGRSRTPVQGNAASNDGESSQAS